MPYSCALSTSRGIGLELVHFPFRSPYVNLELTPSPLSTYSSWSILDTYREFGADILTYRGSSIIDECQGHLLVEYFSQQWSLLYTELSLCQLTLPMGIETRVIHTVGGYLHGTEISVGSLHKVDNTVSMCLFLSLIFYGCKPICSLRIVICISPLHMYSTRRYCIQNTGFSVKHWLLRLIAHL